MAAKFWLLSQSIPLTILDLADKSDDECRHLLEQIRWGGPDQQACPSCGVIRRHYNIQSRRQWRCKDCGHTFSVTSGTPFADRKMSFKRLLVGLLSFVINHKGVSALALRRVIGGQYRTSYVFQHKIREVLMMGLGGNATPKLCGIVEMDGAHFSGRRRKGRKAKVVTKEDKTEVPKKYSKSARTNVPAKGAESPPGDETGQHRDKVDVAANPTHPNRRIVIVMREVDPESKTGAKRTITAVVRSENKEDIERLVKKHIQSGSTVRTDELPAYTWLQGAGFAHRTVNHSVEFSTDDGVNQNQAESFFSRLRRAVFGVYHRMTPKYMLDYAQEMGWREDVRGINTEGQLKDIIQRVFRSGVSVDWFNYGRLGFGRKTEASFA